MIGIVFALFGLVFAIVGVVLSSVEGGRAQARTATAEATIVDLEARTSTGRKGRRHTSYYPVLEFEDSDHMTHRGTQNVSSGHYEVGDVVEVRYDPMDPEGNLIMVANEGATDVFLWVFCGLGAIFFIVGIILLGVSAASGRGF